MGRVGEGCYGLTFGRWVWYNRGRLRENIARLYQSYCARGA